MKEQIDIPTQTNSAVCELEQIKEMARVLEFVCDLQDEDSCISECDTCRATALYNAGYRKQIEGMWEIVKGSNGKEKMVCTNCRHQQDLASTFTFCPNCGARMKGVIYERED